METTIIITDVTRMTEPRVCVAGVTEDGRSIRPVLPFPGLQEDWLYNGDRVIVRPFARVTFDLLYPDPHYPHTEDWFINRGVKHLDRVITEKEREIILDRHLSPYVSAIFGSEIIDSRFIGDGTGECSLGTIQPMQIDFVRHYEGGKGYKYRIRFTDALNEAYDLPVNDLSFRYYVDYLRTTAGLSCSKIGLRLYQILNESVVYFRIGLTRGYNPDETQPKDRCYLQITGVYTFPDYLNGCCFADYNSQPE